MISIIAAVAKNGVIGKSNELPWYIPEDLKHFKKLTLDKTVLMGKNTFESILKRLGKPLPNRKNVVVSKNPAFNAQGAEVYNSIEEALNAVKKDGEIMVCGGAQIFNQLIGRADKLYITEVHNEIDGDVFFPEIDKNIWKETEREDYPEFSFVTYIKKDDRE